MNVQDLELEESEDDFQYEEVEVLSDDEDDADLLSEDLDTALRNLKAVGSKKHEDGSTKLSQSATPAAGSVHRKQEVMDDFIRNFFVKMGLQRTSEVFEAEWYELKAQGKLASGVGTVPDVYMHNMALEEELQSLRRELQDAVTIAGKASSTWDRFRKERDFHRMHHKRVAQEKNKLIQDIRNLKTHYSKYEPTIIELKKKYEAAMKEKMLASIERDRLQAQLEATRQLLPDPSTGPHDPPQPKPSSWSRDATPATASPKAGTPSRGTADPKGSPTAPKAAAAAAGAAAAAAAVGAKKAPAWPPMPTAPRANPTLGQDIAPALINSFSLQKTFQAHLLGIANVCLHPSKPIVVTASDDKSWKMWHLPHGDLIMSGEGHKDWVAGVDFHPQGRCLASGSGDSTVKIWDFEKQSCVKTCSDHTQAVWSVSWHDLGDYVASGSLDHSARIFDVQHERCRQVLRGHVDSVNEVAWMPYTNNLATCSSDKTVSVWDARTGLCCQTYYGHHNSCNSCLFNPHGTLLASTDADGIAKLWDIRMVAELMSTTTSKHPANKAAFDRSGVVLAIASDDENVKCYNSQNGELICEMSGHEEAVQAVVFDQGNQFMVSVGSDHTFRLWS